MTDTKYAFNSMMLDGIEPKWIKSPEVETVKDEQKTDIESLAANLRCWTDGATDATALATLLIVGYFKEVKWVPKAERII